MGQVVQVERREARYRRAGPDQDRYGGVREPCVRPADRGRQDRLLEVPQCRHRGRVAVVCGKGEEGGPCFKRDRRVFRILLRKRQAACVVRTSGLRACIRVDGHRLLHRSWQLFGTSNGRGIWEPACACNGKAIREKVAARNRFRSAYAETVGCGDMEDAGRRYRGEHQRGGICHCQRLFLLVVRHVGRQRRFLRRSQAAQKNCKACRDYKTLFGNVASSRR